MIYYDEEKRYFPLELLNKSNEERLDFFVKNTFKHELMEEAFERAKKFIGGASKKIIFIIGPAGVGKSCLIRKIEQYLFSIYKETLEQDSNIVPWLSLCAHENIRGAFNWVNFYKNLLKAANEPLIEHKMSYPGRESKEYVYRDAAISCLENRKVKVVLVDEAQHIAKITRGQTLLDQLETLKFFVDNTPCIFVLVGTYDLANYLTPSSQVNRRSALVHFPRYHIEEKDEYEQFASVVMNFELRLPLLHKPDLLNNLDYIYSRCLGCVGILKDWLVDSLKVALENNTSITLELLKQVEIESGRCLTMLREAIEGEAYFLNLMTNEVELYQTLKIPGYEVKGVRQKGIENKSAQKENVKPGERLPSRDIVGA